jgi:hypothetical protein
MRRQLNAMLAMLASGMAVHSADFAPPVRIQAGGIPIKVETPGYACPCLADINGDGIPDLLVGQFNKGKITVYPGLGKGIYGPGEWLQAEGQPAEVPGVW